MEDRGTRNAEESASPLELNERVLCQREPRGYDDDYTMNSALV